MMKAAGRSQGRGGETAGAGRWVGDACGAWHGVWCTTLCGSQQEAGSPQAAASQPTLPVAAEDCVEHAHEWAGVCHHVCLAGALPQLASHHRRHHQSVGVALGLRGQGRGVEAQGQGWAGVGGDAGGRWRRGQATGIHTPPSQRGPHTLPPSTPPTPPAQTHMHARPCCPLPRSYTIHAPHTQQTQPATHTPHKAHKPRSSGAPPGRPPPPPHSCPQTASSECPPPALQGGRPPPPPPPAPPGWGWRARTVWLGTAQRWGGAACRPGCRKRRHRLQEGGEGAGGVGGRARAGKARGGKAREFQRGAACWWWVGCGRGLLGHHAALSCFSQATNPTSPPVNAPPPPPPCSTLVTPSTQHPDTPLPLRHHR